MMGSPDISRRGVTFRLHRRKRPFGWSFQKKTTKKRGGGSKYNIRNRMARETFHVKTNGFEGGKGEPLTSREIWISTSAAMREREHLEEQIGSKRSTEESS